MRQPDLQMRRPWPGRIQPYIGHAGQAGLDLCDMFLSSSGEIWALTRNISFSRSLAVSTVLGVNWATSATKDTWAGITYCGAASSTSRTSVPSGDLAGRRGGQEEGHVDIAQVNQVQHPAAGGDHLAGLGDAVLHPAVAGRLEGAVFDIGLNAFDVGLCAATQPTAPRRSGSCR